MITHLELASYFVLIVIFCGGLAIVILNHIDDHTEEIKQEIKKSNNNDKS